MPISHADKAAAFKSLHERPGIFVVPNPWDAGSAKMLASLGFEALATTSGGLAFSLGKPDSLAKVTREETLANVASIVDATALPVSADLENGFSDSPEAAAETILLAAKTGLCGGSIEDATGNPEDPIYPFDLAVRRVQAAVKAARGLSIPFVLTARAENLLKGRLDMDDTIRRLVAFAEAGADVLFAPGVKTPEEISAVVRAVSPRPVNVIMGLAGSGLSLKDLEALGVKRVSLGSSLARAAYGSFLHAAEEVKQKGTFTFANDAVPYGTFNSILGG
jgi:2-methylisocitrate lyase-like PEP mutase family enzyme